MRKKFTGKTRAEVITRIEEARSRQRRGLPTAETTKSVRAFLTYWADTVLPGTVSEGTEDTYRRTIKLYIDPTVGSVPLAKLTPAHVTDMLRTLEDKGLSPETRRLARAVLRRALRRAEQEGILARNVAAIADGPRIPRVEGRSLTPDEAKRLLAEAAGDRLEAAYLIALALGLRRGEVLGLRWSDLNLDAKDPTLTVRQQLLRMRAGLALSDVKTARSRRTLHVPAPVVDALRAHRARQSSERLLAGPECQGDKDLVFTTPFGTPVDPDNFKNRVAKLAASAGLGHWSTHELRHSCASLLLAMGVPLEVVSETLGHSSIRVTKDVYGHLMAPARKEGAKAIQQALWS